MEGSVSGTQSQPWPIEGKSKLAMPWSAFIFIAIWTTAVTIEANSLNVQSTNRTNEIDKAFSGAIDWVIKQHLNHCSFTSLGVNDEFSDKLSRELVSVTSSSYFPIQIYQFGPGHHSDELLIEAVSRREANCNAYIFLAKSMENLTNLLEGDDPTWDWGGRYVFITFSSEEVISRVSNSRKLKRTPNVLFLIPGRTVKEVAVYTHNLYGSKRLMFLTLWTKKHASRWVNLFPEKVADLHGDSIRVFSFDLPPTMMAKHEPNGSLTQLSGGDYWLIESLGSAMNFTPVYLYPGPELWGDILPNGTYTGIVGRIQRGEGEIGVAYLFINTQRLQYVAFTTPYSFTRACLLTPAPRELPRWMSILFPFSLYVWIVTIAVIISLGLVVPVFAYLLLDRDKEVFHRVSGSFLTIIALFCNAGVTLPRTTPMQVLLSFIILAGFITTVFYACNLTAYMMVKAQEKPYTSFKQIANSNLTITGFGLGWKFMLKSSVNEYVHQLADRYYHVDDTTGNIKDVVRHVSAQLGSSAHNDYLISVYYTNRQGESPLRIMTEDCLNSFSVGAIVQHHSPLLPALNKVILRLLEGGILDKFHEDTKRLDKLHVPYSKEYLGFDANAFHPTPKQQPLSLLHLQGSFLLLAIGCVISFLILVAELWWSHFEFLET